MYLTEGTKQSGISTIHWYTWFCARSYQSILLLDANPLRKSRVPVCFLSVHFIVHTHVRRPVFSVCALRYNAMLIQCTQWCRWPRRITYTCTHMYMTCTCTVDGLMHDINTWTFKPSGNFSYRCVFSLLYAWVVAATRSELNWVRWRTAQELRCG